MKKSYQLEEVAALMDDLAPSLLEASRGVAQAGEAGNSSSSGDGSGAGSAIEGETVVGRCTAAALSTGVDCVLDEEFSASRDEARVTGFARVRGGIETCGNGHDTM